MKQHYAILGACLLAALLGKTPTTQAQAPTWQRAVGLPGSGSTGHGVQVVSSAVDASGNVLLLGSFEQTMTLGNIQLTSAGTADIFVAKWSPTSGFVWAQRAGGAGFDGPGQIAVSGANIYVTGVFRGTADFGATTLSSANNAADLFVAKLTDNGSSGAFGWAQRATSTGFIGPEALAVNGSTIYLGGSYTGTSAQIGPVTLTNPTLSMYEGFVAKLTDTGSGVSYGWVQPISGGGSDRVSALCVSGSTVYVAGHSASRPATLGSLTLSSSNHTHDAFVAKLADAGASSSFTWARNAGGPGEDFAYALAVNGSSVYVGGSFGGTYADFGSLTLNNTTAAGGSDAYVAKLTDGGAAASWTWALPAGGTSSDLVMGLTTSGANLYAVGSFGGPATFGPITLTSAGGVFLSRLADQGATGNFAWAQAVDGPLGYFTSLAVRGNTMYLSGSVSGPATFGTTSLTAPTYPLGFLASLTDNTTTATVAAQAPPLACYPNPARSVVQVPGAPAAGRLVLLDQLGRAVRAGRGASLDLRGVAAGLYVLRLEAPGQLPRTARLQVE